MRLMGKPETTNAGCRNAVEALVHPALEPARLRGPTTRGGFGGRPPEGTGERTSYCRCTLEIQVCDQQFCSSNVHLGPTIDESER